VNPQADLHAGEDDIWVQVVNRTPGPYPRPALFLDRDGVIVEEAPYLHRIVDARLRPGVADAIAAANARALPVVVVTNQGGIGLGKYDWDAFARLQDWMWEQLAARDAFVNAILACPHHPEGKGLLRASDHPDRKPNPGMLLRTRDILPIDLGRSWMVGDRDIDVIAARKAGLAGAVHLLSGNEKSPEGRKASLAMAGPDFRVVGCDDAAALVQALAPLLGA